jgi:hypothetical protein
MKKELKPTESKPIEGLLCGAGKLWHHASRLGTYVAVQDPPGTITLTPYNFDGEAKVVHSMEELRLVDVE